MNLANGSLIALIIMFLAYYLHQSPKQTELKNENAELKKTIIQLETENAELKTKNAKLQKIILELQKKISKKRRIISSGIVHNFHDPDLDKI
jgi:predicted RNase H-like nuclease (RuvC/YqgF family)